MNFKLLFVLFSEMKRIHQILLRFSKPDYPIVVTALATLNLILMLLLSIPILKHQDHLIQY